ncbi:ABC transporter ATP-binding protein [Sulfurospirillum deleyianum]|uniref:ABC transporter related protein n=1 Tax=Sulfurospirillum deleyianum (strain ATCC 51133 / DSM 6946 / 5175) TaxID=525898 RepID=D1B4Q5_SULD5|nr:ABC transporter ATP-binding protein [Sulfurospirillum deleyianum]ACZ13075.1 ABC transporter related protein [Sulfurospirillum deleyianum DSM 6946]
MSFYEARNLHFAYNDKVVLQGVDLCIQEGSIVSLLGSNGVGKSTLMKLFLGLLNPTCGEVMLKGKPLKNYSIKERALHISYVPQSTQVAFAFCALDIVLMGRIAFESCFKRASKIDISLAHAAMERLGILHLEKCTFQTLSGGEKQLVLIARSLAQGAKILVMDEPVSGLDYGNQLRLLETIILLSKEGYTFLKSTHFPEHALMLGGYTYALKKGRILAHGDTHETITQELINELYNTNIALKQTVCGYSVCIPSFVHIK